MLKKKKQKKCIVRDSRVVYEHSLRFFIATDILYRTAAGTVGPLRPQLIFPVWVMGAFAGELLLKCVIHIRTGKVPRTHSLLQLFRSLGASDRTELAGYIRETLSIDPLVRTQSPEFEKLSFDALDILKRADDIFTKLRYNYESSEWPKNEFGPVNPTGLNHVVMALRRLILKEFPNWPQELAEAAKEQRDATIVVPPPLMSPFESFPIDLDTSADALGVGDQEVAYRMYIQGRRFVDACMVLCQHVSQGCAMIAMPSVFSMAFGIEVLLKCLIFDRTGTRANGHCVRTLFESLPMIEQEKITGRVSRSIAVDYYIAEAKNTFAERDPLKSRVELDFQTVLDGCDEVFDQARFAFDESVSRDFKSYLGIDNLCDAILARVHRLHPDWSGRYSRSEKFDAEHETT